MKTKNCYPTLLNFKTSIVYFDDIVTKTDVQYRHANFQTTLFCSTQIIINLKNICKTQYKKPISTVHNRIFC